MARSRSYRIFLSKKERNVLKHLQKKAVSSNARTRYAVLLAADENARGSSLTNSDIAIASGASIPTVIDTLKNIVKADLMQQSGLRGIPILILPASRQPVLWRQK